MCEVDLTHCHLHFFYLPFVKRQSIRQIAYYYTKHYFRRRIFSYWSKQCISNISKDIRKKVKCVKSRFEKKNKFFNVSSQTHNFTQNRFLLLLKTSTFDLTQCHLRVAKCNFVMYRRVCVCLCMSDNVCVSVG